MRIPAVSLSIAIAILAGCGAERETRAPSAPAAAEAFKPVASVKQIMQGITIPASNAVFAVAGTEPTDDAAWQAVEASALAVAESGNLLLMKPRAVDDAEWRQYSLALIDAGARAAEAARSHDAEMTSAAGDELYSVCEECHSKYLPKGGDQ